MNSRFINPNKGPNKTGKIAARTGLEGKLEAQLWTYQFDSLFKQLCAEIMW